MSQHSKVMADQTLKLSAELKLQWTDGKLHKFQKILSKIVKKEHVVTIANYTRSHCKYT